MQILTIHDFPRPADVELLGPNSGTRIFPRAKRIAELKDHVAAIARKQGIRPVQGFAVIRPVFVYPQALRRDDDNAATGVTKVVRDALTKLRIWPDDSITYLRQLPAVIRAEPKTLRFELSIYSAFEFAGASYRTAVEVTEIGPAPERWSEVVARREAAILEFAALFDPILADEIARARKMEIVKGDGRPVVDERISGPVDAPKATVKRPRVIRVAAQWEVEPGDAGSKPDTRVGSEGVS